MATVLLFVLGVIVLGGFAVLLSGAGDDAPDEETHDDLM